jgi:hypothetical protein
MSQRRVPAVPPRPLFAIVIALRHLLVRMWRRLAPPEVTTFESILYGLLTVHTARTACELGLPEQLAMGPRSVEELAHATGTQPVPLARFLRTLASHQILIEDDNSRYALTRLGRTLLPGTIGSMRGVALTFGSRWMHMSWQALADTLRTGRTGFEIAHGCTLWKYLAAHPDEGSDFHTAMVDITATDAPAFARTVDFSRAKRVCDVGGGQGTVLAHVLALHPHLEGVLFDEPAVLDGARQMLDAWGVTDRVRLVGGDFFSSLPTGCDVYFLRNIVHDWDDVRVEKILRTIRAAMETGQRVLIYDMQRSERASPHPAFSLDLMMLVVTEGGRERSLTEMQALLTRCGFRPGSVTPLAAPLAVVEGVAV